MKNGRLLWGGGASRPSHTRRGVSNSAGAGSIRRMARRRASPSSRRGTPRRRECDAHRWGGGARRDVGGVVAREGDGGPGHGGTAPARNFGAQMPAGAGVVKRDEDLACVAAAGR